MRACVVVADDEPVLRHVLARALRERGYECLEAASGREALALVEKHAVDVILSDVSMPDLDGIGLLRLVRERTPDLPVLLMTGMPDMSTAVKAVEYGAREYLLKPVELARVVSSVEQAVTAHRAAAVRRHILDSAVRSPSRSTLPHGTVHITAGTVLGGRYRVVKLLGMGGMGTVYEAVRDDHDRVAIKVLHARLAGQSDAVGRFRREAHVIASLEHPNIVSVLDFASNEGHPTFIVMERLYGRTLAETIERDPPFSAARIGRIASQMLSALEAAHQRNVLHRDLKPENVFLVTANSQPDFVKLLDFGLAKLVSDDVDVKLTATGSVVGTPAYMAPEYARGEPASVQGDVYGVGCVMYEALTGKPPFLGDNYNAMLFTIQKSFPVPLSATRPDVSPQLIAIVERAMNKDAKRRFATASAMGKALDAFASGSAV